MGKVSKLVYLLRKQLIIGFTISMYILGIYYFFFEAKIIWGLVFTIFFFSFAHFFIIELKKTEITNLLITIIVLTIISLGILGFDNIFYTIGIIVFNIASFFLFWDIYEEVYNRIEISSYKVFTMGVKMFSLLLSLVFALSFLGTYRTFNITCNQIYDTIKKASTYTVKYFKQEIPNIENKKVKDIINIDNIKLYTGENNLLTGLSNDGINKETIDNFKGVQSIKFKDIVNIDFWKNVVINQIMENKKILDKGLCETIVENIKDKYNKPQFQFAVLFLIFLLFYPIIRLILYILAIINFIAFKMMNVMKLYRFRKVVEDVEMIE